MKTIISLLFLTIIFSSVSAQVTTKPIPPLTRIEVVNLFEFGEKKETQIVIFKVINESTSLLIPKKITAEFTGQWETPKFGPKNMDLWFADYKTGQKLVPIGTMKTTTKLLLPGDKVKLIFPKKYPRIPMGKELSLSIVSDMRKIKNNGNTGTTVVTVKFRIEFVTQDGMLIIMNAVGKSILY